MHPLTVDASDASWHKLTSQEPQVVGYIRCIVLRKQLSVSIVGNHRSSRYIALLPRISAACCMADQYRSTI